MTGPLAEAAIAALIVVGGAFVLIGSIALVRLRSLMERLHGPTMATTLGLGGLLVASMLHSLTSGRGASLHELLIALFLFITAPVSAHMIAKAHLHRRALLGELDEATGNIPDPPPPDGQGEWSTHAGHDPPP